MSTSSERISRSRASPTVLGSCFNRSSVAIAWELEAAFHAAARNCRSFLFFSVRSNESSFRLLRLQLPPPLVSECQAAVSIYLFVGCLDVPCPSPSTSPPPSPLRVCLRVHFHSSGRPSLRPDSPQSAMMTTKTAKRAPLSSLLPSLPFPLSLIPSGSFIPLDLASVLALPPSNSFRPPFRPTLE